MKTGISKEQRKQNTITVIRVLLLCLGCVMLIYIIMYFASSVEARKTDIIIESTTTPTTVLALNSETSETKVQDKFTELLQQNADTVGILNVGKNFNVPVVQGKDNKFYLTHSFDKSKNANGAACLDCNNGIYPDYIENRNFIIYGHNMLDGNAFANLKKYYGTVEAYKKHPTIEFDTLYSDYKFAVVGAFITNAYPQDDNGYVFPFTMTSIDGIAEQYREQLQQRFIYSTGIDIKDGDTLLTLYTCSYDFTSARFVVVAKLVQDDYQVDTSKAKDRKNVRYPQGWYDKHNKENPYAKSEKWTFNKQ